jgi:hypothetical protein
VGNVFEEDDGSRTVMFRSTEKDRALRVRIPKERVADFEKAGMAEWPQEFRQNYLWYRGKIERATSRAGFHSRCEDPQAFELAGPQVPGVSAKPASAPGGSSGKPPARSGG